MTEMSENMGPLITTINGLCKEFPRMVDDACAANDRDLVMCLLDTQHHLTRARLNLERLSEKKFHEKAVVAKLPVLFRKIPEDRLDQVVRLVSE